MQPDKRVCLFIGLCFLVTVSLLAYDQAEKAENPDPVANERTAVGSLRTLNTAQYAYAHTYPDIGFTCNLVDFSPPATGEKPSAKAADLVHPSLTSGTKSGYKFTLICPDTSKPQKTYKLAAVPVAVGKTGQRAFCTDQTAVIRSSPDGKAESCFSEGNVLK